jgi:hypothetical protein
MAALPFMDFLGSLPDLLLRSETVLLSPWLHCADHKVALSRRSSNGFITAILEWHHYGDLLVARLRRSSNGTIAPIINKWLWGQILIVDKQERIQ